MAFEPRIATIEELNVIRIKAKEKREKYISDYPNLRQKFTDESTWKELASVRKIKLPLWYYTCDPKLMKKWLRKLGITQAEYFERSGELNLEQFANRNANWPLWAWFGVTLELFAD